MRSSRVALLAGAAIACLAVPALGGGLVVQDSAFVFSDAGSVHVQARFFDGLASTKMGFLMFQGESGQADDRLSPGARCTEWHGTFTQVTIKARVQDRVALASFELTGHVAAIPADADPTRAAPGFVVDLIGGPGAFAGRLLVCDHPDGDGVVDFEGAPARMPFTHVQAYPSLVQVQEDA